MEQCPALLPHLAQILGERARRFDAISRDTNARYENVHHVPLIDADLVSRKAFADDGFHPSKTMHKRLARRIEEVLRDDGPRHDRTRAGLGGSPLDVRPVMRRQPHRVDDVPRNRGGPSARWNRT